MSTTRERLDQLKKKKGIPGDSELLRRIHPYLLREGKTKHIDVEEFVKKTKGSFGQMVDGKNGRVFDQDFYLPLEIVLETSMAYLLEGRGEQMPSKSPERGLRYAALTDTKGNYEKLIEEGVYLENDEYQWMLLDYILQNDSKNGLEFFAERDELPLNEIGCWDHMHQFEKLGSSQYGDDDLIDALVRLCSLETIMKYFNGFYFAENAIDPHDYGEERMVEIMGKVSQVMGRDDVRHELCSFKRIPLSKANPHLRSADGKPLGETGFVNIMFSLMLDYAFSYAMEMPDEIRVELLDKAFQLNEEIIPMILSLSYDKYRIGDYGYVYSDFVVCGSIANLNLGFNPTKTFSPAVLEKIEKLNNQVQSFHDRITASNQATILGREMKLAKQDNPDFYAFYRLMEETDCELVARYDEEKSEYRDCFLLPEGEKTAVPHNDKPKLYPQALKALATIDSISESALGQGKIYHFPGLTNRSFYAIGDFITGIAPTEVVVGERYDNLAEFLVWACLFTPYFQAASSQVSAFATSLKEYGIKKKEIDTVLKALESYFTRSMSRYDKKTERGKLLIANAHARIIWCELFADEIKEQF